MNDLVGVVYLPGPEYCSVNPPVGGFEAELRPKDRLGGGPRGGAMLDSGLVLRSWVFRESRNSPGREILWTSHWVWPVIEPGGERQEKQAVRSGVSRQRQVIPTQLL